MMILSRIWYAILAILLAAAYYVVALSVGQYNRRNAEAMEEALKADSQAVGWALQVDARRRLETLLLPAVDETVRKAIRAANGKESVPSASREDGAKALRAYNDKLPAEYKSDQLFIIDRDGRVVASIVSDASGPKGDTEFGGYPAVFDALHGFFRDDTWVRDGRIGRVVARPVEDDVGQLPIGAVFAIRWVDSSFAKELGKRTRTNLAFFALGQRVSSASSSDLVEERRLEAIGPELSQLGSDKGYSENGRTDVLPLGDGALSALFVRLPGDAWELGAGVAVVRPKVSMASAMGFISGADDIDKQNVKLGIVALIALASLGFGLLFSFLEHSLPLREMKRESEQLKAGQVDSFALPRFRGGLRTIAADVNAGIERIVEKGGGTVRRPADLVSILGPIPAQPNMSAFSLPEPSPTLVDAAPFEAATNERGESDEKDWRAVFEEFLRTKAQCGEPTDGLSYEKFVEKLRKNRDALVQSHGCKRVKFTVYVKEGRASLKASPMRD
jgi:hypothetical protein